MECLCLFWCANAMVRQQNALPFADGGSRHKPQPLGPRRIISRNGLRDRLICMAFPAGCSSEHNLIEAARSVRIRFNSKKFRSRI
ncbi:hypothetical protein B2M20_04435 [Nitrobacter vulgaris]|uniref:Uncharacterized protein n=1 Tax=Nitrobacter vulgaris TaxID=29421 RepID=A0A1V4I1B3_NITVU|nr:hypothetical protein B2M20_04435 [Nitrobacter vulgaris]